LGIISVEAIDPDIGDVLTYSLVTAPIGLVIDSATGLIQWNPDPTQIRDNPVTVKVEDQGWVI
jgi:hypothetical protein